MHIRSMQPIKVCLTQQDQQPMKWTKGVPILYVAIGATFMEAQVFAKITSMQFITYMVFPQWAIYFGPSAFEFSAKKYSLLP